VYLWSGRTDCVHQEGVALAVQKKLISACISWTPVNQRILCVRSQHTAGHLSVIVAYAPTEKADRPVKEQFYVEPEVAVADFVKNDIKVMLGDFNAVTSTRTLPGDAVVGSWIAECEYGSPTAILQGTSSQHCRLLIPEKDNSPLFLGFQ